MIKHLKYIACFIGFLLLHNKVLAGQTLLCLTGKVQSALPEYKNAIVNAANLALSQYKSTTVALKTYFYDNRPLSPITAYNNMLKDHCSAIIGYEYLSDLLLISKKQKNDKIPIFTSYASSSDEDQLPSNFFIFEPSYEYQAKKMMEFLLKKFGKLNNTLVITEMDRSDLMKYKFAYEKELTHAGILYDTLDFISSDTNFETKLNKANLTKNYRYIILLTNAVNSTTAINLMNDNKKIFIGTENFGSSSSQSVHVRLKDKQVQAYSIRNIDFLQKNNLLKDFSDKYIQQYISIPLIISAYTYDAVSILMKSLSQNNSISPPNILKTNFEGITGASVKNGYFHRSNNYIILSIKNEGFKHAE